ncbi:MAG: anthranilate synthase component I family protein [Planctomycetota bacterium]
MNVLHDLPLVWELDPELTAEHVWWSLAELPGCLFLDSAQVDPELGRYSFVAADPFDWLELPVDAPQPLELLRRQTARYSAPTIPHLPPFQGGLAGLFSYDLGRSYEELPSPRYDEFQMPALAVGCYDVVVAFDHLQRRAWLISHGFPATGAERRVRAQQRLAEFQRHLVAASSSAPRGHSVTPPDAALAPAKQLTSSQLAPQFDVRGPAGLTSNFREQEYLTAVAQAVEYIHAGDIFQVNLAQRLLYPARDDSRSLYRRLRRRNPAPFAAYFDLGAFQIVSASPERFIQVRQGAVETRPIKGTRQRSRFPEADLFAGDELQASEKDRAENVMIVDLLRNDLSRVCLPDSVQVSQLCGREVYQFVQHLVSVVRGELAPGRTALDLIAAAFPGGSITGAPKVRAMEIIAELEPTARGPYCGSLGYLGFDGTLDLSILIRTITAGRGWWQLPVGGGIVAQSDPRQEYEETWHKATGLLRALET